MSKLKHKMPRPLNERQQRFVAAYRETGNARAAAEQAGYASATAACRSRKLLSDPRVQAALTEMDGEGEPNSVQVSGVPIIAERVVQEWGRLAFANLGDLLELQPDGMAALDMQRLTPDLAAAITEVVVDEYKEGRGEAAREVKRIRVKLASKQSALDSLGKHFGLLKEQGGTLDESELIRLIEEGRQRAGRD